MVSLIRPFTLSPDSLAFPSAELAMTEPNGLLAVGGDLSPERLLSAYRHGIFPWFNSDQPLLWWSPDPRLVFYTARAACSRSLRQYIKRGGYEVRLDCDVAAVIDACAKTPRAGSSGTWITRKMRQAYLRLFERGYVHTLSLHRQGKLIAGLYGVQLGAIFFGESMFHLERDASKAALFHLLTYLSAHGVDLVDAQMPTDHLLSQGGVTLARAEYLRLLSERVDHTPDAGLWQTPCDLTGDGKSR